MNGSNEISNLVDLTPEEHFLAHQLLVKIYPHITDLVCAAHLMCYGGNKCRINNKSYGWIKRRLAIATSLRFKGIPKGIHDKITCPHCGASGGSHAMKRYHFENCTNHPDKDLQKINKIRRKGKPQSEETKAKRKETQKDNPPHKGKLHSNETKLAMSQIKLRDDNPRRGVKAGPQPVVICPHCGKTGGILHIAGNP